MNLNYNPDLAAADHFATLAECARFAASSTALPLTVSAGLRGVADAAEHLGRLVYSQATGGDLPAHPYDEAGAYAAAVYDPDHPAALEDVTVTIAPATETAR